MNGEERRKSIVNIITSSNEPLSGTQLAKQLGVSRQVIVNDIALIRANNIDIISTHKGYIINTPVQSQLTTLFMEKSPLPLRYIQEMISQNSRQKCKTTMPNLYVK